MEEEVIVQTSYTTRTYNKEDDEPAVPPTLDPEEEL